MLGCCTSQSDEYCNAETARDFRLNKLSECIYDNTIIKKRRLKKITFTPHLIVNELHRIKLDSNREIGEAALGNSRAENTWNEIHDFFANRAKYINENNCNFGGLVIDLHGQSANNYIHVAYRINTAQLQDPENYLDRASIRSLIIDHGITVTEALSGDKSLGTLLENYGYPAIPSSSNPTVPPGVTYYSGGETLNIHGSQTDNQDVALSTDAIMIEVPGSIRENEETLNQFCLDFSEIIVEYLQNWYDINQCKIKQYESKSSPCIT